MRWRGIIWVLLLAGVAVGPFGQAQPDDRLTGRINSTGPVDFDGVWRLDAEMTGLFVEPSWQGAPWQIGMSASSARFTLFNVPLETVRADSPTGPPVESSQLQAPEIVQTFDAPTATFAGDDETGTFRILPRNAPATRVEVNVSSASFGPPGETYSIQQDRLLGFIEDLDGMSLRPAGRFSALDASDLTQQTLPGQYHLIALGTLRGPGGLDVTAKTGILNETRSTYDPHTNTGRFVYDNYVLVAELTNPKIFPESQVMLRIASRSASVAFNGTSTWQGIDGDIYLGKDALPADQDVLQVHGALVASGVMHNSRAVWDVDGHATAIDIDDNAFYRIDTGAAVTAVGLAAMALLLLTALGKGLLTFIAGKHTPALVKAKPLGSPTRRLILQLVHKHQPIRAADIARLAGASKTNVRYHLRILAAHDILQTAPAVAGGERECFMLNSGSLMYATPVVKELLSPDHSVTRRAGNVLAVAHGHPIRRAILDALQGGPLTAGQLHHALQAGGHGIAASTLSYHVARMVDAHALTATREGRTRKLAAAIDNHLAKVTQYRKYLRDTGIEAIVRVLHEFQPASLAEIQEALQYRPSRRSLRARLMDLHGLGLVDWDVSTRRFQLNTNLPWDQVFE